jgi:hypothetical protein
MTIIIYFLAFILVKKEKSIARKPRKLSSNTNTHLIQPTFWLA